MTMMEVLSEIRDRQGRDVLLDGKRLLGLFEDYSKGKLKPEFNALRVLVECGGNKRIAQLRNAPPARQKTELHWLMREMVTEHSMQEAMARAVCEAVWEAFCGTKAPLSLSVEHQPAPVPPQPVKSAEELHLEAQNRNDQPQKVQLLQDFFSDNPDFHPPEAEKRPIPLTPEAEKKPIPPKPKRVIDASTRVLLILGVLGTVGFLLMALNSVELAREFFGMRSGQWRMSLVCVLLAVPIGWRCWRLWTEEIKPTYTTRVKAIYSAAAALFYCVVLDLSIIFFICALADMQGAVMCYTLLASLLAAVGAIFQITWHEAFWNAWSEKPPKLKLKNLFLYLVLGIVAWVAATLVFLILLLVPELIKNAAGKGVVIFLWTVVHIVLVVLAYRFVKENGYLLNPTLKKQLAMISGVAVILFSLYIIYINLNFEGGARPGPIAAMLLLLVLTIKRMIHIQKRGFVFPKPSKLSLGYSQNVAILTGGGFWFFFIGLPFIVIDMGGFGSISDNVLMLAIMIGISGFETLWHWSKITAKY